MEKHLGNSHTVTKHILKSVQSGPSASAMAVPEVTINKRRICFNIVFYKDIQILICKTIFDLSKADSN